MRTTVSVGALSPMRQSPNVIPLVQVAPLFSSDSGTLTLPDVPAMGDLIVLARYAAQGISSSLPSGAGAAWFEMAFRSGSLNSGAAMYGGLVGASPTSSITLPSLGNVSDTRAFVFRSTTTRPDKSATEDNGSTSMSIIPTTAPTLACMMVSSRSSAGVLGVAGWMSMVFGWRYGTAMFACRFSRSSAATLSVSTIGTTASYTSALANLI